MTEVREAHAAQFHITWNDSGRWPQVKPNPAYPDGIDVDGSAGAPTACRVMLPYPAKRIGSYALRCKLCDFRMALTTAGRPDDPRSVTVPCRAVP